MITSDNPINKEIETIVEDIQKAQVDAGGNFIRQQEVREITVGELLDILVPNGVMFNIKFVKRS